jgi:hypothetical protein
MRDDGIMGEKLLVGISSFFALSGVILLVVYMGVSSIAGVTLWHSIFIGVRPFWGSIYRCSY